MAKVNWSRKAVKQLMTLPTQDRSAIKDKVGLLSKRVSGHQAGYQKIAWC